MCLPALCAIRETSNTELHRRSAGEGNGEEEEEGKAMREGGREMRKKEGESNTKK